MNSAQVVETTIITTDNIPSQDYANPGQWEQTITWIYTIEYC